LTCTSAQIRRCRSAGPDDQEALPCRDQTRKRIALVHPLAAPSWIAPANHFSIRRNHGSPVVSTRVLQHIPPESGHWATRLACPLSAKSGQFALQQILPVLDHLIGNRKQCGRHGEAEYECRLRVDDEFELARLHNRQICRLRRWWAPVVIITGWRWRIHTCQDAQFPSCLRRVKIREGRAKGSENEK